MLPSEVSYRRPVQISGSDPPRFTMRPIHIECEGRNVYGSVGHQRGLCSCNGGPGTMDDPPGMTRREAARGAVAEAQKRHPATVADENRQEDK